MCGRGWWSRAIVVAAVICGGQAGVVHAFDLDSSDARVEGSATSDSAEGIAAAGDASATPQKGAAGAGAGFQMPPFSVRLDPFNWLIAGRLGLELEVAVWKFISVELVPVMIVNAKPASFHFGGREEPLSQHSAGLGPLAGASLGVAFWLFGTPLQGYVARLSMTNIGVTYEASNESGVFDKVDTVERQIQLYVGSHSRFGFFTVGGGLGVGYELEDSQRCFVNRMTMQMEAVTSSCQEDQLQILLDPQGNSVADLHGPFHPFYLIARFSIGVAFN
jgi:hypothetical protein